MPKQQLRVVGHGRMVPSPEPSTVLEATRSGGRLAELKAIRSLLAKSLDSERTSARDLASLSRRFIEVSRDIESLSIESLSGEVTAEESREPKDVADAPWNAPAI